MSYTDPPDFAYDRLMTETDLNTYLRDNMRYFKSNPVIASGSMSASPYLNNPATGAMAAITLAANIPADIGAWHVDVSAKALTMSVAQSWNDWGVYITDSVAGTIYDGRSPSQYYGGGSNLIQQPNVSIPALYFRTVDFITGLGTSHTVVLYLYAGSCETRLYAPTTMRVVRSY